MIQRPDSPWNDAQIRRFMFRVELFKRRGVAEDAAEAHADRLALRDFERDDRRLCLECSELQRDGGCFAAKQGRIPGARPFLQPTPDLLVRCNSFNFVKPQ